MLPSEQRLGAMYIARDEKDVHYVDAPLPSHVGR